MKKSKMQSQNKYIGDDKMEKLLAHYQCPMPLNVVKMRFAGAVCSPNMELRPTDVISSLWEQNREPRLQTKEEAELFFKFFMGLWDEIFAQVKNNALTLPPYRPQTAREYWFLLCRQRAEELAEGWVEGFWGGREDLQIPAFVAELVDSLTELAGVYRKLGERLESGEKADGLIEAVKNTDKTVNRAFAFIIENSFLPRMAKLQQQ